MTITEFLLARISEDETWAHVVQSSGIHITQGPSTSASSAARVLAECEAKRRIVELHGAYPTPQAMTYGTITACQECGSVDDSPVEWPCPTLRHLASIYADHPDFREEWRI